MKSNQLFGLLILGGAFFLLWPTIKNGLAANAKPTQTPFYGPTDAQLFAPVTYGPTDAQLGVGS